MWVKGLPLSPLQGTMLGMGRIGAQALAWPCQRRAKLV